jgi:peroxiredoxin
MKLSQVARNLTGWFGLCLLAATPCCHCDSHAATPENPHPQPVAEFSLRDYRGKLHKLSDYSDRELVVLVFLGTECPLVKLYAPRLEELQQRFANRKVAILGVNSNPQDTLTEIASYARQHSLTFPILKDADGALADALQATRTPEVVVLDGARVVRYQGRIDDQYTPGVQWRAPKRQDLAVALDELLADDPVSVSRTEPAGCLIGRAARTEPKGNITYASHVAAIFNRRCVECHRAGEIGPFPLTSYDEAAGWADMIREVVQERRMPPWFADPKFGHFDNNARLTDEELTTLCTWVDNGAPAGDLGQAPPLPQFTAGWQIREPDLVFHMSDQPFVVRAEGTEEYQSFELDPGFTEDVWIQQAEARPGNRTVVHHHLAYFIPPGGDRQMSQVQNQIAGYAPGTPPFIYPPGTARRIPAGSKLVFQMHYTPVGSEQTDRSSLGLVLADPKTVQREVRNEIAGTIGIRIPPGDKDHRLHAKRRFRHDTLLLNLAPHMHLRGKSFRFELEHPDGTLETLLDVPKYDFNWQLRYDLAEPRLIPAGSKLHCYASFDNSADNPWNPDPTKEVTFGEQTWEEMMFGVFQTVEPAQPAEDLTRQVSQD